MDLKDQTNEDIQKELLELQKAYNELQIKEQRYRFLAENARDVIWTMKIDGTITYISPAVEQLRGFTVEEAMNQPIGEIITPASQLMAYDYMVKLKQRILECFRTLSGSEDFCITRGYIFAKYQTRS